MIHPHSVFAQTGRKHAWLLLPPLAFVLLVLVFSPISSSFELDKDEGVNLMKALLVSEGHTLYSEIWSDQPPLLTEALAGAFRLFGATVEVGRLVILGYSALLLFSVATFLAAASGPLAAILGCILIALLPYYAQLSVSVMVGLPALSLGAASLAALMIWHRRRQTVWLLLSAVALSLSVMTKAITLILVPITLSGLIVAEHAFLRGALSWHTFRHAGLWAVVFAALTGAMIVSLVGIGNISQLIETHLAARHVPEYRELSIESVLNNAGGALCLACIGGALALFRRRWLALYPLCWTVIGYAALEWHAPVWYHQQLVVTIPAAMLCAIAAGESFGWLTSARRRATAGIATTAAAAIVALVVSVGLGYVVVDQAPAVAAFLSEDAASGGNHHEASEKEEMVAALAAYADETTWVLTDRPMYAFRANLCVPPYLAVITRKRLATNALTEQQVLELMIELEPEQVLLTRFRWPAVARYLAEHYAMACTVSGESLYVRSSLVPGAAVP